MLHLDSDAVCTNCYWLKHGLTVKLIWAQDGREQIETREGVNPIDLYLLQESEGLTIDGKVLIHVRVETPEVL